MGVICLACMKEQVKHNWHVEAMILKSEEMDFCRRPASSRFELTRQRQLGFSGRKARLQ